MGTTPRFLLSVVCLAAIAGAFCAGPGAGLARAGETGFVRWVNGLWPAARAKGVSWRTFARAFSGVAPDPEIGQRNARQPEFVTPIWEYMDSAVTQDRIARGRARAREHAGLLEAIEAAYGVDRHILLAIWGMETNYGAYTGDKYVIRSLATLGHSGRRAEFGRNQLLAALQILERGDIAARHMTGSWAGAMGHTQFIPTTYNAYAVDFDGDGRRNVWRSVPDALASAANYLGESGWRAGETWGYEVTLPTGFDYGLSGKQRVKTLREWWAMGVRRARDMAFPRPDDRASLILPAGAAGPAFLVIPNFHVLLRYNNADSYALAVGHLADRIRDESMTGFEQSWPVDHRPLARTQRFELQRLLARKGYLDGAVDGIIGSGTRAAVRAYQRASGLAADGYPSVRLLERLRGG